MPPAETGLTLPEEVLLLGYEHQANTINVWTGGDILDDAAAAAQVLELVMRMRFALEPGRRADTLVVADDSPTGDALLDRALRTVQARSEALHVTPKEVAEATSRRCASAYRQRLELAGLLGVEKARGLRAMLTAVFYETTRTRVVLTDAAVVAPIHARIASALEHPERAELRTVALIGVLSHSASLASVIVKDATNLVVSTRRRGPTCDRKVQVAKQLPSAYQQLIETGRVGDPSGVGAVCCAVIPAVAKAIREERWSPLDGGS
jgi:hypothetical protein